MSNANVEIFASFIRDILHAANEFGRISEYKYLQTRLRSALNIRHIANFFANIMTFIYLTSSSFS